MCNFFEFYSAVTVWKGDCVTYSTHGKHINEYVGFSFNPSRCDVRDTCYKADLGA